MFTVQVVALLAFVNGMSSNKRALDRVLPPPRTIIGDCNTDKDCPDQFICVSVCNKTDRKKCFPAECSSCPSGWTQFKDKCYLIQDQYFGDFYFSKGFCEERDAIIAEPRTPEENEFLKEQIVTLNIMPGRVWIGLTNFDGNGYVWSSDGTAPTYTDWDLIVDGTKCASYKMSSETTWMMDKCIWNSNTPLCQQSVICTVMTR